MNFHLNMKALDDVCLSMPEMKSRKAGCPHSAHIRHQNQKNQRNSTILRQQEDAVPAD